MRIYFTILFLLLFTVSFSQNKIDTAQVVVSGRINSEEAKSKPYVIMISADGFRYDYAEKYSAQNLLKLSAEGVQAKAMIPSYPSITFPNHWSLITGLYPSHHGLIDNFFYDYKLQKNYAMNKKDIVEDGRWYGG
ncbi:alkaline phosphatase family protein, partial [Chryseobacterium sp. Leaf394]|uniref:alkaline phosphatase family protein n=1 Tax=Chryseobacterium sp. Leaf394 TaxID=1736361 RepID=UPI001F51D8A7